MTALKDMMIVLKIISAAALFVRVIFNAQAMGGGKRRKIREKELEMVVETKKRTFLARRKFYVWPPCLDECMQTLSDQ